MGASASLEGPRFELALGDPEYPSCLASIPNPPKRIYGIGDVGALGPGIGIIGARKASPYGISCAEHFARHAARRGLTIVAGGARGCDLAAHRMAVQEGAPTVIVFGSGADVVYPKQGRATFQAAIEHGGAVISEQPWGSAPLGAFFPQRNRIIAGLSILLLIAEAGLPSGTFSTADAALSQGIDVAVVPGAISSPNARGSNRLLRQGALPVVDLESFDDCLDDALARSPLPQVMVSQVPAEVADMEELASDEVLRALSSQAYRLDELSACFGIPAPQLAARLSRYEMQGLVGRSRDGRYQVLAHV